MLFEILWSHGYFRLNKYKIEIKGQPAETWPLDKEGWREMLPRELHDFAGNFLGHSFPDITPFSFKFALPPKVRLAPPPSGETVSRLLAVNRSCQCHCSPQFSNSAHHSRPISTTKSTPCISLGMLSPSHQLSRFCTV
jgi:hypothetical protein